MKHLRKLLFPFSALYGLAVYGRNKFFDWGWRTSKSYAFPVICVGNLSVGGTGKTPMVEYLIRLLKEDYHLATLSRGYKRKTKGFYLLKGDEEAVITGDEPLQFKVKFPEIAVAVDENRQNGIGQLRKLNPTPQVILLDDAFQHRKVQPGFTLLLTAYDSLYTEDWILPAGNLREPRLGAKRADIIVVTKCPDNLKEEEQLRIKNKIQPEKHQKLFFSKIAYADFVTNGKREIMLHEVKKDFTLVTGIAKPKPLVEFLQKENMHFVHKAFPDHHNFSEAEINELKKEDFIMTTEKDFMRLKYVLPLDRLFYISIEQQIIKESLAFDTEVKSWVNKQI